nr:PREDICTED: uncharacterized protein LOC107078901 [Lepisosteus oculatus]
MEDQERGEPQSPHGSSSVPDRGSAPGSTCTDRRPSLGLDNVLWTGSRVAPDCFHPNSPVDSEGSLKSSGQSGASRRSPPARRDQSAARAYGVGQPEPRAGGCVTAGGGTDSWPGLGESGVGLGQQEVPEVGGSPSDPSVLEDSACAPSWLRLRDSAQEEEPPPWELLDRVGAPLPQDGPPGREPTPLLPRCDSRGDPLRPQPTRGRCLPERSLVEWISSPPQS